MSRILITGGAGFIGTSLAKKCIHLDHDVHIIDFQDKFTIEHSDYNLYPIDIREFNNFSLIKDKKFDYIFHLAAQTSGAISQDKPELDVDTNVKGTLNVCNYSRICGAKKIIFTSSMATYGNKNGPINEEQPQTPISNYGVSKVAGEMYIKMFNQFEVKHSIFRLFNVYGPGQDMSNLKQGMASIFMSQAITSNEIEVTGALDRYRDFIYIDDVIDALLLGLNSNTDSKIINVGSGKATTVDTLINLILDVSKKDPENFTIKNIGGHEGDQFGSIADTTKLTSYGWQPTIALKDGLNNMHTYAKEILF